MGNYVKRKKDMNFASLDSLQSVANVVNDASLALNDKTRTIKDSPLSEVVAGALGAGVGGAISFAALYAAGTVGLSAAGITSALAAAGAIVGGGMTAGIFVLAAPLAALAGLGVGLVSRKKNQQLKQEKERLYKAALEKQQAIIKAIRTETEASKERMNYLEGLNILLKKAIEDLRKDLGYSA